MVSTPDYNFLNQVARTQASLISLHRRVLSSGSIVSLQCAVLLTQLDQYSTQADVDAIKRWLTNYL